MANDSLVGPILDDGVDPDIELITDFLLSELSPAEMSAVEDRLARDEVFLRKVAPIIKMWNSPMRLRELLAEEVTANPAARPSGLEVLRMPVSWRLVSRVLLVLVAVPLAVWATLTLEEQYAAKREVRERGLAESEGRPYTGDIPNPKTVTTGLSNVTITLLGGDSTKWRDNIDAWDSVTRIVIQPNTVVTYGREEPPFWAFWRPPSQQWWVAVEGEADFVVRPPTEIVRVRTLGATVTLGRGEFMIYAPIRDYETLVGVKRGEATAKGNGSAFTATITRDLVVAVPWKGKPFVAPAPRGRQDFGTTPPIGGWPKRDGK
jgi:hypothetical protein